MDSKRKAKNKMWDTLRADFKGNGPMPEPSSSLYATLITNSRILVRDLLNDRYDPARRRSNCKPVSAAGK